MTNGSIESYAETTTGGTTTVCQQVCQFVINATSDYQVQISCSGLNLTTTQYPYSYLPVSITWWSVVAFNIIKNRLYLLIDGQSCRWIRVSSPRRIPPDPVPCRTAWFISSTIKSSWPLRSSTPTCLVASGRWCRKEIAANNKSKQLFRNVA